MNYEELKIGKRYLVQHQKAEITFVTEIISARFDKESLESEIIHCPVFYIDGYGMLDNRPINATMWNILFKNVHEVNWSSKNDCPELLL